MLFRRLGQLLKGIDVLRASHYPAAATDAVVTVAGVTDRVILTHAIQWSYASTPVGRLTIKDGSTVIFDVDITATGPGGFNTVFTVSSGAALEVRLYSGGGGVTGKLNVQYTTEPA